MVANTFSLGYARFGGDWQPYEGPKGGKGWQRDGEPPRYQDEKPGDSEGGIPIASSKRSGPKKRSFTDHLEDVWYSLSAKDGGISVDDEEYRHLTESEMDEAEEWQAVWDDAALKSLMSGIKEYRSDGWTVKEAIGLAVTDLHAISWHEEYERREKESQDKALEESQQRDESQENVVSKLTEAIPGVQFTKTYGGSWYAYYKDLKLRVSDHPQVSGGGYNEGTGERMGEADIQFIINDATDEDIDTDAVRRLMAEKLREHRDGDWSGPVTMSLHPSNHHVDTGVPKRFASEYQRYEGPKGGKGWQRGNEPPVYQTEKPGDGGVAVATRPDPNFTPGPIVNNLDDSQIEQIGNWMAGKGNVFSPILKSVGVDRDQPLTEDDRNLILLHAGYLGDESVEREMQQRKMLGTNDTPAGLFVHHLGTVLNKHSRRARRKDAFNRVRGAKVVSFVNKDGGRLMLHRAIRKDRTSEWQLTTVGANGEPFGHTNPPTFEEGVSRAIGVSDDGYWNEHGFTIEWTDKDGTPATMSLVSGWQVRTIRMSGEWQRYEGPRGGRGWQRGNEKPVYQDEKPGDGEPRLEKPAARVSSAITGVDVSKVSSEIETAVKRGISHFGVRAQDAAGEVGDAIPNSSQLGDDWRGEELDGASTIALEWDHFWDADDDRDDMINAVVDAMRQARKFGDGALIIVGGTHSYEGTEFRERVIRDPEVISVLAGTGIKEPETETTEKVRGGVPKKQTDTPEFKRWFGKSRVLDHKGQPQVVFTGQPRGKTEFDEVERSELPFGVGFFTDSREIAAKYSGSHPDERAGRTGYSEGKKGRTYRTYLNISKPFDGDAFDEDEWREAILSTEGNDIDDDPDDQLAEILGWEYTQAPDDYGGEWKHFRSGEERRGGVPSLEEMVVIAWKARSGSGDALEFAIRNSPNAIASVLFPEASRKVIQGRGYDGLTFTDSEMGGTTFVPMESNQVKLARGNRGTFDPDNPNIKMASDWQRYEGPKGGRGWQRGNEKPVYQDKKPGDVEPKLEKPAARVSSAIKSAPRALREEIEDFVQEFGWSEMEAFLHVSELAGERQEGWTKYLKPTRKVLIDAGFYKPMTQKDIDNTVTTRRTKWAFKLKGVPYTIDRDVDTGLQGWLGEWELETEDRPKKQTDTPDVEPKEHVPFKVVGDTKNSDFIESPQDLVVSSLLKPNQESLVRQNRLVPEGTEVGLRIDIHAFNRHGEYVVTIHGEPKERGVGGVVGYDRMARVENPTFWAKEDAALLIMNGMSKTPAATVRGNIVQDLTIPEDIDDWTPVGFNPKHATFFYDKRTGEEIASGDEAISIGNTVFVKGAKAPPNARNTDSSYDEVRGLTDKQKQVLDKHLLENEYPPRKKYMSLASIVHGVAAQRFASEYQRYEGPRGGTGWQRGSEPPVYQDEKPGESEGAKDDSGGGPQTVTIDGTEMEVQHEFNMWFFRRVKKQGWGESKQGWVAASDEASKKIEEAVKPKKSKRRLGAALVRPSEMSIAPERFQYKFEGIGSKGVTGKFKDTKFNPTYKGLLTLWHDTRVDKYWVINGHHRYEMADRAGWNGLWGVEFIEADTDAEARAQGALINIAEGNGTPMDAAKFMRDMGLAGEEGLAKFKEKDIALGKLATEALKLANLSDQLFREVVYGRFDKAYALIIGETLVPASTDDTAVMDVQNKLMGVIRKSRRNLSHKVVREMALNASLAPRKKKEGGGGGILFGDSEEEELLFEDRAIVQAYVRSQITSDVRGFGAVADQRREELLRESGIGDVSADKAGVKRDEAEEKREAFDRGLKFKGEVGDELNRILNEATKDHNNARGKEAKNAAKRAAHEGVELFLATLSEDADGEIGKNDGLRSESGSGEQETRIALGLKDIVHRVVCLRLDRISQSGYSEDEENYHEELARSSGGRGGGGGVRTLAVSSGDDRGRDACGPESGTGGGLAVLPESQGGGQDDARDQAYRSGHSSEDGTRAGYGRIVRGATGVSSVGNWVPFLGVQGEKAGRFAGWENTSSGEKRYQENKPGDHEADIALPQLADTGDEEYHERYAHSPYVERAIKGPRVEEILQADPTAETPTDSAAGNWRYHTDDFYQGGLKAKFKNNISALNVLAAMKIDERDMATPEEQLAMSKFVGWGQYPALFNEPRGYGKDHHARAIMQLRIDPTWEDDKWNSERTLLRELLTREEFESAKASILNAHFTHPDVVKAHWKMAKKLGFNGGRFLETSAGNGYYLGLMPSDLAGKTSITAVENDRTTGAMLKALYPDAHAEIKGFENYASPDDFYHLVASNVPFGKYGLHDKRYNRLNSLVHDYFFLKSADLVKHGGLVMHITSTGTMDKPSDEIRKELMKTCDLVAAVRFPGGAHKENAGTDVVTDMLILRKRHVDEEPVGESTPPEAQAREGFTGTTTDSLGRLYHWVDGVRVPGPKWDDVVSVPDPDGGDDILINRYFAEHPENILGRLDRSGTMYRSGNKNVSLASPEELSAALGRRVTVEIVDNDKRRFVFEDGSLVPAKTIRAVGAGLYERKLNEFIDRLPEGVFTPDQGIQDAFAPAEMPAPDDVKEGGYAVEDGKLYQRRGGSLVEATVTKKTKTGRKDEKGRNIYSYREEPVKADVLARVIGQLGILAATRGAMNAELRGGDVDEARVQLNLIYDEYVREHGFLHERKNVLAMEEAGDDFWLLQALEKWDEENETAIKRDMFTKDTLRKPTVIESADSVSDGFSASLQTFAGVNVAYIANLTGRSEDSVAAELVDKGIAFEDPGVGWKPADIYLSGNVRKKLIMAQSAAASDTKFEPNVAALLAVQPEDKDYTEIGANIGAPWIPKDDMKSFAAHLVGLSGHDNPNEMFDITHTEYGGWNVKWTSKGRRKYGDSTAATVEWGVGSGGDSKQSRHAVQLMEHAMTGSPVVIKGGMDEYIKDNGEVVQFPATTIDNSGNTVDIVNQSATTDASAKVQEIRNEFKEWLWDDDERTERLARLFNDNYNNIVDIQYDGSHQTFHGMNPAFEPHPHIKDFVWRTVMTGKGFAAHEVGTGKTAAMIMSAMELRRLGLAKKPCIACLKSNIEAITKDVHDIYPGARVLSTSGMLDDADKRKSIMAQMATGDYDVIVMTHDNLGMLKMKPENEANFLREEIRELEEAKEAARRDDPSRNNRTVKALETAKKSLEKRIRKALDVQHADTTLFFEETGIDHLFVDEAHKFKTLPVYTKLQRVKGIPTGRSDRATSMLMRTRWLLEQNGGRGVTFASGTPISNTMAEMYTWQKYLQHDELKERGISSFDDWRNCYGEIEHRHEFTVAGEYKGTDRFSRFANVSSLMNIARQVLDVQKADDLIHPISEKWPATPEFPDGQPVIRRPIRHDKATVSPKSPAIKKLMASLAARAQVIKKRTGKPQKGDDNMLVICMDGRKGALDMRLLDDRAEDDPNSKTNKCVRQVLSLHNANPGKAQLIFSDLGVHPPKTRSREEASSDNPDVLETGSSGKFRLYDDIIDKLVAGGIPRDQIADFSKLKGAAKERAQAGLRTGEIKVALGSTQKLGTGVNVQDKLMALHHLDVPWTPSGVEQRDGRGWRHKNGNTDIDIHRYITEGSLDAKFWSIIATKSRFINQVVKSTDSGRDTYVEEDAEILSPEYIMAVATGDHRVMEKIEVEDDVNRLRDSARRHRRNEIKTRNAVAKHESAKEERVVRIKEFAKDVRHLSDNPDFNLTIGHSVFNNRSNATEALSHAAMTVDANYEERNSMRWYKPSQSHDMGHYRGMPLVRRRDAGDGSNGRVYYTLQGPSGSKYTTSDSLQSIEYVARSLVKKQQELQKEFDRADEDIARLLAKSGGEFAHADELATKEARLKALNEDLAKGVSSEDWRLRKNPETTQQVLFALRMSASGWVPYRGKEEGWRNKKTGVIHLGDWEPYEGQRGGKGWKKGKDIIYRNDLPGKRTKKSKPGSNGRPATPQLKSAAISAPDMTALAKAWGVDDASDVQSIIAKAQKQVNRLSGSPDVANPTEEEAHGVEIGKKHPHMAFEAAAKYAMDHDEIEGIKIVHGVVNMGMGHGWVEIGEKVFDGSHSQFFDKESYYDFTDAKVEREYTPHEARIQMLRSKHWGMWHDDSKGFCANG